MKVSLPECAWRYILHKLSELARCDDCIPMQLLRQIQEQLCLDPEKEMCLDDWRAAGIEPVCDSWDRAALPKDDPKYDPDFCVEEEDE